MKNRPFEFRFWHIDRQAMYEVAELNRNHLYCAPPKGATQSEVDNLCGNPFGIDEGVVMQFTGMFDGAGNKIFEGDVLRLPWETTAEEAEDGERNGCWYSHAVFDRGCFGIVELNTTTIRHGWSEAMHELTPEHYYVIGNIYQHPDLTKLTGWYEFDHDPFNVNEQAPADYSAPVEA